MIKTRRTLFFILFSAAVSPCFTISQPGRQQKIPVKGYQLVWQDEFTGNTLNTGKWKYAVGKRRDAVNAKETVFLDGKGYLHLQVKKKGDSLLAAMVSTEKLYEPTYGYFECRAKLTKALGMWPAFWMQSGMNADYGTPEKNGVEIDIFEYFPNLRKDAVTHNLHWGGYGVTHKEVGFIFASLQKTPYDFHVFGLEWTDTSYTTFVDGKQTAHTTNLISKVPQFIRLSVECDKNFAGPLEINKLPDDFIVDYVRVYKKKTANK